MIIEVAMEQFLDAALKVELIGILTFTLRKEGNQVYSYITLTWGMTAKVNVTNFNIVFW
jgi:hypothetical protein